MEFSYILENIKKAKFAKEPFPHLLIEDFLSEEHLKTVLNDQQIHFGECKNNNELRNNLIKAKYKIQNFPGCASSWAGYKKYLKNPGKFKSSNPVEGAGITFRLTSYDNKKIKDMILFMNSNTFHMALRDKFEIANGDGTRIISAIQKNLTGYEISPHPDVRKKCLTYLLNINKNDDVSNYPVHTRLLEFKNEYKEIANYWEEHTGTDRVWVPWDWCNNVKTVNKNNTMIIFKPSSNPPSLHAIKLSYDHLPFQRTQIYGNLMYLKKNKIFETCNYKSLLQNLK